MGLSKTSAVCNHCEHFDDCDNKRMEACAVIVPERQLAQSVSSPLAEPLMQEMAVKHDYRNVKIAENTTVTIDLVEVKEQLKKDFYKQLGCGFLGGAKE